MIVRDTNLVTLMSDTLDLSFTFVDLVNLISAGVAFPITDDDDVSRLLDDINTSPDSDWFRSKNPVLPA